MHYKVRVRFNSLTNGEYAGIGALSIITLKCQINEVVGKISKFNKWAVKVNGGLEFE